jgi:hypothetical protein
LNAIEEQFIIFLNQRESVYTRNRRARKCYARKRRRVTVGAQLSRAEMSVNQFNELDISQFDYISREVPSII